MESSGARSFVADHLTGAVFAYQWVRHDLATFDDTDIEGAIGSTYTVTDDDEGKAIKVRVTFTDDAGNGESLTSYARLSAPLLVIPDEEETPESSEAREAEGEQETPLTATIHDAPESHDATGRFLLRAALQRGAQGRLQLQDAEGPCLHGDGR